MEVKEATFLAGAPHHSQLPEWQEREVAVVGRSNVGKSTFINKLTGVKHLARASSTPGRTTELNCFRIRLSQGKPFTLVDLPGFGYAKLAKTARAVLSDNIATYLQQREQLRMLLLLNDIRRDPEDDELGVRDLAVLRDLHVRIVLTKVDKLTRSELSKLTTLRAEQFGVEPSDLFLSGTDRPVHTLWKDIRECVDN